MRMTLELPQLSLKERDRRWKAIREAMDNKTSIVSSFAASPVNTTSPWPTPARLPDRRELGI